MNTWNLLQNIWFVLIGVLLAGYSILDGFDLGIGTLFPFLAGNEEEKEKLVSTIGPFWDGNEVWLLTAGGALFAAFPQAYATVFSGFYLALMLVLFSLIFRAVSLEFRAHDPRRKKIWEWAFTLGSFLPALFFGVALGNVLVGIPLNENMDFIGNFLTLIRPFPLAVGLLGCAAILLQGTTFAFLKNEGPLKIRAGRFSVTLLWIYTALLILCFLLGLVYLPGAASKPTAWIFTVLILVSLGFLLAGLKKSREGWVFGASSTAFLGLWGIAGSVHYPYLVRASNDLSLSLMATNASSSELTLKVMLIIAILGMPVVIGITVYLYRVFRGKIEEEKESY
ncbi:MAG: cytochrome d ubiquinol oxidase subunit II [Candidatus Aminicenantes bacterium]|nr:cytochrome d ubiquinol oxidase subunit II [Candidatus Aminicenantes bacterium]